MRVCTVFGASAPPVDEYEVAHQLGVLLAKAGISIVNGGYFGTMEAVSKGAASVGNVSIEGIVVPSVFVNRPKDGNAYLTKVTQATSLTDRIDRLINASRVFVVLPGSVGSMAELVAVWNEDYCCRLKGGLDSAGLTLVCWRKPWEEFISGTCKCLNLSEGPKVIFVDSAEEAAFAVIKFA